MKRLSRFGSVSALTCAALILFAGCAHGSAQKQPAQPTVEPTERIRITKRDDLPQHTYPFTGQATELIASPEQIAELAAKVRANAESDLATYQIDDRTTLKRMYGTLLSVDLLEGKYDAALARHRSRSAPWRTRKPPSS